MNTSFFKIFLLVVFAECFFIGKSQVICNASSRIPTNVFYPNTNTNFSSLSQYTLYLCGPNTVVYDTVNPGYSKMFLVNTGSTLTIVGGSPGPTDAVWLKAGATLILKWGNPNLWLVMYEPGATIIDMVGGLTPITCTTTITFPSVNCFAGINEIDKKESVFKSWPNPTSDKINIELLNSDNQFADISIINFLGETIYEVKQWQVSGRKIPIDFLSNGSYFLCVKTKTRQEIQKLIVVK